MAKKNVKKYYAIKSGINTKDKIVETWDECKKLTHGYPSIYKSFLTKKEAEEYLGSIKDVKAKLEKNNKAMTYKKDLKKNTVYVANEIKGFRVDKELWKSFEDKCAKMEMDKNKALLELIKEWIE